MSRPTVNKHQSLPPSFLSDTGPSQILPFLHVGCQDDAISNQTMQDIYITHVINVSTTGDRPLFLHENDDEHFLRIPVNDCLNAQILPYFDTAYEFIEKARLNNGRVFIHCLAGISRSPTLAIAYIMRYLHLSADNAYQYVKQRRSQISPNFNFLGQLSEYERILSITSQPIITPMMKCRTIETPVNDRRRFVQVEGCSNVDHSLKPRLNSLSRPKTLFSTGMSAQTSILTPKLKDSKTIDKSSTIDQTDLLNTYSQGSKPSSEEWKTPSLSDSTSETTTSDVLTLEVLVL